MFVGNSPTPISPESPAVIPLVRSHSPTLPNESKPLTINTNLGVEKQETTVMHSVLLRFIKKYNMELIGAAFCFVLLALKLIKDRNPSGKRSLWEKLTGLLKMA